MKKKGIVILCFLSAYILIPVVATLTMTGYLGDIVNVSDEVISGRRVEIKYKNATKTVDINKYIIMVVANMYKDSDSIELIKAESVLIRTRICRAMNDDGVIKAEELGLTYLTERQMKSKWGDDYDENYGLIADCVAATNPFVIKQEGICIDAKYTEVSCGKTMSGKNVLGDDYAYLAETDCQEDINSENYLAVTIFSNADFAAKMKKAYKDIEINEDNPFADIKIITKAEAGYVLKLQVGNVYISGDSFCKIMGLNSSCMEMEALDNQIRITTKGKGCGFGMSLYSANIMAENGSAYEDIIKKFYTGVSIEALD